jgi:CheY-like chemotaxis protein
LAKRAEDKALAKELSSTNKSGKEHVMSKKILAIDDEVDTLAFYTEVLEDYNFTPITAENGLDGVAKAREEKPDLILLDIMMPKQGGIKTYKEMKNDPELKHVPVVIITGISKEVDYKVLLTRQSTGKISPEGHLIKPVTAEDLVKEIRRILGA